MQIDNIYFQKIFSKIIETQADLRNTLLTEKMKGKKVVLVKGVYDLFHSGHLFSFLNAKAYADFLIVGVNRDSAVRKRKGVNRPVVNETNRAILIAGLECVNLVTFYDEESPYKLISTLKPDFFAASHFDSLSIAEKLDLESYTKLVKIPRLGDDTTSAIITKLVNIK